MFSIGEFSRVAGMTVKTLRFYHEQGLLVPAVVDPQSGYRYYSETQIDTARAIAFFRGLEFSIADIKQLLEQQEGEQILSLVERQRDSLRQRIVQLRKSVRSLDDFLESERQAHAMAASTFQVEEKKVAPLLIAGIRMKGRYSDCGKAFAKLGRSLGRFIRGKPMLLHYDAEYHEDDADFEAAMPISQAKTVEGISTRELPAATCITLLHKGPYDQLGSSYAKILTYAKHKNLEVLLPTREVYLKGPGMIFKGKPKNYLTEIQLPVKS
jgi:DNA-binding transcriptional MerR regulator